MPRSRDDDPHSGEQRPSKSARKRDALAAQHFGEELIALPDAELEALALPEALVDAVREARGIRSRGAGARQRQYIGRLMRDVDVDAVRRALARREAARRARRYNEAMQALVGIVMGSRSDWETLSGASGTLDELGVPYEVRVISAHRTPDLLYEYASTARERGLKVIIAGAGGAAHLPGMTAAKTTLPVLGVPVQSRALQGLDSLLSIVQMPAGVPVATFAIGSAGAVNAALCAAAILAASGSFPEIDAALRAYRERQTQAVLRDPDPRSATKP
jgi:5-(carboxyamino)imidazole ribonucleotide mutase